MSNLNYTPMTFDADTVDPSGGGQLVLETGIYDVAITKSPEVKAKPKEGEDESVEKFFIAFNVQVLRGPQKDQAITVRITSRNPSDEAVRIGREQISAICWAVGHRKMQQGTIELHGKPFKISVEKVEYAPGKYNNEVKGYLTSAGLTIADLKDGKGPALAPAAQALAPAAAATLAPAAPAAAQAAPVIAPAPAAAAPAIPAAPAAPAIPAAPVAAPFPPEGWILHPTSPGYYYKGDKVLAEAELRALPAAPAAEEAVPSWLNAGGQ